MKDALERAMIGGPIIELNAMVDYVIDSPKIISLHVGSTNNEDLAAKYQNFLQALDKLASQLCTDPRLAAVETIAAASWIVTKHPDALKKLGFIVDNNHPDAAWLVARHKRKNQVGDVVAKALSQYHLPENIRKIPASFAYMTRKDFLEHFPLKSTN